MCWLVLDLLFKAFCFWVDGRLAREHLIHGYLRVRKGTWGNLLKFKMTLEWMSCSDSRGKMLYVCISVWVWAYTCENWIIDFPKLAHASLLPRCILLKVGAHWLCTPASLQLFPFVVSWCKSQGHLMLLFKIWFFFLYLLSYWTCFQIVEDSAFLCVCNSFGNYV